MSKERCKYEERLYSVCFYQPLWAQPVTAPTSPSSTSPPAPHCSVAAAGFLPVHPTQHHHYTTLSPLLLTHCHCHTFWFLKSQTDATNNSPSLLALSCTSHNLSVELSGPPQPLSTFLLKPAQKTNLEVFWNVCAPTKFMKYWNWFIRQCLWKVYNASVPGHLQLLTQGQRSLLQPSSLSQTSQSSVATADGSAQSECTFTLEDYANMHRCESWFSLLGWGGEINYICAFLCFFCLCVYIVHLVSGQWHVWQESVQQRSAFGLRWLQHRLMLLWKNTDQTLQSNCLKGAPITFHSSVKNHSIIHTTNTVPRFVSSHWCSLPKKSDKFT